MFLKFLGCLSTPLLLESTSVENFEQLIKHSLKVTDCYRSDLVNLAPWADLVQLERILKY